VSASDLAGDDGRVVADSALEETSPPGGEVRHGSGHPELQMGSVDHIDVGAEAGTNATAVS
jgi:hypothetical protein